MEPASITKELTRRGATLLTTLALGAVPEAGEVLCNDPTSFVSLYPEEADSVALDGDRALVGAFGEAAVLVFDGSSWSVEDVLPGNQGSHVALEGDTAVVGSVSAGTVFVYARDESGWSLEAELEPSAATPVSGFGTDVAISGDRILVAAPNDEPIPTTTGSVFVYERGSGSWTETVKLFRADGVPNESFGRTLDLDGDRALIGDDDSVHVYAFHEGVWMREAELLARASESVVDVALDGDRALVSIVPFVGRTAVVFERGDGSWSGAAPLFEIDGVLGLGLHADLDGDVAVLSGVTCLFDTGGQGEGAAGVYRLEEGAWTAKGLVPEIGLAGSGWHHPLALEGHRLLIGSADSFTCAGYASGVTELFRTPASTLYRNAGTNPTAYTTTGGSIGEVLQLEVEPAESGHEMALVFGFDSPFELVLGGGQVLLCLDLLGSGGELVNTGFHPGPLATIELPVPNEVALVGFAVSTQALLAFGAFPFALTNAIDLVIGGPCTCP